jgi:hypothetical protein
VCRPLLVVTLEAAYTEEAAYLGDRWRGGLLESGK